MTMKQAQISGWKFIHPDVEQIVGTERKQVSTGLALTSRTSIDLVSDDDAVRQSVLMLLSTRPGERLMHPDYGCNLQQLVFSPNNDTTAGIAIYLVRTALKQWEPRIDIHALDAYPDPLNPAVLIISLQYQVRMTGTRQEIQLSLNLAGEEH
jgi:phage baseplate assembly protein W